MEIKINIPNISGSNNSLDRSFLKRLKSLEEAIRKLKFKNSNRSFTKTMNTNFEALRKAFSKRGTEMTPSPM